jgi:hypothetical protein
MFRALKSPSSEARQTAFAASGFRMNVEVEVFSAVVGLLVVRIVRIVRIDRDFFCPRYKFRILHLMD